MIDRDTYGLLYPIIDMSEDRINQSDKISFLAQETL